MKKLYYMLLISLFGYTGYTQTKTNNNIIEPDFVIGNYGISIKDKTIGRYRIFDCSDDEYHAECYGYFKAKDIDFNTTSLVFLGDEVSFIEDTALDLESLKVIKYGYDSQSDSRQKKGLYIDKDIASSNLPAIRIIDSLKGFEHLDKQFLSKEDSLAYLDNYGFYKLNDNKIIDRASFTPIIKNLFYDKNAVYYVEYGYSWIKEEKFSDIIKLQDLKTNQKPNVTLTEHYYVINNKVYDANRLENELLLNPKNIHQFILQDYSGDMLVYDDNTFYNKQYRNYNLDKADCETDYEKEEIQCLFPELKSIDVLRKTGFVEYHLDYENKTLFYDAHKNLGLTETSGNLYAIDGQFYFNDFDRFSLKLDAVNIWNTAIESYEQIDLDEYSYINDAFYYYKGNLYGHHSELLYANFNLKNARVLNTDIRDYILNKDLIIDLPENKNINLDELIVLKTKSNNATNYLIGNNYLIYNNQIIEGVNTEEITVLSKDVLKTKTHLINKGEKMPLSTFPFKIKVLN